MFSKDDYHILLEQLEKFFTNSQEDQKVSENLSPEELSQLISLELSKEGSSEENIHQLTELYLKHSVKTSHPRYFNQLWGGFQKAGFMGDIISSAANTSMYTHEVAPVATLIEKSLVKKMGKLAGFPDPEGQFTTGGSNGNLMAMLIARQKAMPQIKANGSSEIPKLTVYCSAESHYSISKGAIIMGLGTDQVRKVPVDEQGKMITTELEQMIHTDLEQGFKPFMIVATAGTTVRGAFDPIDQISPISKKHNLWFHVDGAWGGAVLLSKKHKQLMKGIEQADSLVWDAHKMMGMSLICSVLLVRERGHMLTTFSTQETDYIFHHAKDDPRDLGPSTMHCGRRNDSLKLWLTWKTLGDKGWEELIDHFMSLAEHAEQIINNHDQLQLSSSREFTNICFQVIPKDSSRDINDYNSQIREKLLKRGLVMVNKATLGEKTVIRLVICNHSTQKEHINQFFKEVLETGQELEKS